jgi:hypothetical protein
MRHVPDATTCIQAESRLHALDLWLRTGLPDFERLDLPPHQA